MQAGAKSGDHDLNIVPVHAQHGAHGEDHVLVIVGIGLVELVNNKIFRRIPGKPQRFFLSGTRRVLRVAAGGHGKQAARGSHTGQ